MWENLILPIVQKTAIKKKRSQFPLALLYRKFSDREQNLACDILGEDTWVCDNVYQNDTATFDEEMYLEYEYLDDGAAPYLRKHEGRVYGTKRAAF